MNKMVLTSLAGVLFAALAFFHVGLPQSFTQEGFVAAATLVLAAVTTLLRFFHGDPVDGVKSWFQSKTVWAGIVGSVFAILALFGIVPGVDQTTVVTLIMGGLGVVTSILGLTSKTAIV